MTAWLDVRLKRTWIRITRPSLPSFDGHALAALDGGTGAKADCFPGQSAMRSMRKRTPEGPRIANVPLVGSHAGKPMVGTGAGAAALLCRRATKPTATTRYFIVAGLR